MNTRRTIILFLILLIQTGFSQNKILFTYVDYKNDEVRAAISDDDGENKIDIGFNRTYLPVWFGNKIIYNSANLIWVCDSHGDDLTKIAPGFRASTSKNHSMFAFYNQDGIAVYDSSGKLFKQVSVDPWTEVTITWMKNDSVISFYDIEKQTCYLFNLYMDSIYIFGKNIYHPLEQNNGGKILYNKQLENGTYSVFITDSSTSTSDDYQLTLPDEMCVVPHWSNDGNKLAFLRIKPDSLQTIESDMFLADLILYDITINKFFLLANDAGFTDQAYPQFTFDETDQFIFYTAIHQNGNGYIRKINVDSSEIITITKDFRTDERLPLFKSLK